MLIGILSDTHDELARTEIAVQLLRDAGAQELIHCGDLTTPAIVQACAVLPFHFVFGNHDAEVAPALLAAARRNGANCLRWRGEVDVAGKRIGVTHGHMRSDVRRVLATSPDYVFTGHSHLTHDYAEGTTRRINPGALHRADVFSVATLDLQTGELKVIVVPG